MSFAIRLTYHTSVMFVFHRLTVLSKRSQELRKRNCGEFTIISEDSERRKFCEIKLGRVNVSNCAWAIPQEHFALHSPIDESLSATNIANMSCHYLLC